MQNHLFIATYTVSNIEHSDKQLSVFMYFVISYFIITWQNLHVQILYDSIQQILKYSLCMLASHTKKKFFLSELYSG